MAHEPDEAERRDALLGDIDWTAPAPGQRARRLPVPSGELALIEVGDPSAERVMLVPGATGSKEDFALMLAPLAEAGYLVQAVDLAGQYESGQAGPLPGNRYDYRLFVDDLVALLEAGGPAHLLGYSFAGIIAQLVAVDRPDLVKSLALLSCPPESGNVFATVKRIGWLSRGASPRVAAGLMIWGIRTNKNRVLPGRLDFVRARFALTNRDSVEDMVGLMFDVPDLGLTLRESGLRSLVAVGRHDLWAVERHVAFAERIGAGLKVYDTGHSPCETAPHQLVRDLLALYRS